MKLPAAKIAAFLRRPDDEVRAVLLFGPDAGLVRERADGLARAICPDLNDPFRIAELSNEAVTADPARLADETAQLSLIGGRRVVRVRGAGDGLARIFAGFLDTGPGDALIIVEAGELPSSSALRRLFDASRRAAAIGCYPDAPRDRAAVIRETLSAHRVTASRDATQYLVEHLGGDRLLTRSELEKLALYAGDGGHVELDDVRLAVGDSAALDLDDAVMAAAEGDAAKLERVLARVFREGGSPVSVVRALLRHFQRLHSLSARLSSGSSVDEILRAARPPIFYKQEEGFKRQLSLWTEGRLRTELARITEAECHMKTTGLPAETICGEVMLAVAQAARPAAMRAPR